MFTYFGALRSNVHQYFFTGKRAADFFRLETDHWSTSKLYNKKYNLELIKAENCNKSKNPNLFIVFILKYWEYQPDKIRIHSLVVGLGSDICNIKKSV